MARIEEVLAAVRADAESGVLDAVCGRLGIELLVLFGSARMSPADAHDIDLAYGFARGASRDDLAVVNAFGERYGDALDLMPLDRADVVARFEALGGGEPLVELTPDTFAERQIQTFGEYRDTARFRRLQLEVLSQ